MAKMKKKTRGGARKGAGRKPTGKVVSVTKYVRCSEAQAQALDDYMGGLNSDQEAAGLPMVSFSQWSREVLLTEAEREDLIEDE